MWMNGVQVFRLGLLGVVQIPAQLQVHPEVRRHAEVFCQAQGDTGRDALLVSYDFLNALPGYVNELGQLAFLDSHWCQEFFGEHLAGMDRWAMSGKRIIPISIYLVVINDFSLLG